MNKMLSAELDVLKRSAKKLRVERIKNEYIKNIMVVKEKRDIIDITEKERLQKYGHVKSMPKERVPKLIMELIPQERRTKGRPRKTWMEGVQAAMTTGILELVQWRNREKRCLISGRHLL
jgi:hypothetical protein